MGIFDKIKSAIFGFPSAQAATPAAPGAASASAPSATGASTASEASASPAAPGSSGGTVDVEAVLTAMAAKNNEKLNWRTSIVDVLKLIGHDSSLEARKTLGKELGYTGTLDGSAEMNMWLHKQVMKKLAESGGKVPASLTS